jgi:hypothetical protein
VCDASGKLTKRSKSLNFVNNFSGVSVELIDELRQEMESVKVGPKARATIAELTNTLRRSR